jgi:hypothetical protein
MWSAAFSPTMIEGALVLPLVMLREDRRIGQPQPLHADHPRLRVHHGARSSRRPIRQVPQG